MRTITLFAAALGLLLSVLNCHANIGETLDQCMKRYGHPSLEVHPVDPGELGDSTGVFEQDGYSVVIVFLHGVVAHETFFPKVGDSVFDYGSNSSADSEKRKLFNSESDGSTWKKSENSDVEFVRADGNAFASYAPGSTTFEFQSKEFHAQQEVRNAASKQYAAAVLIAQRDAQAAAKLREQNAAAVRANEDAQAAAAKAQLDAVAVAKKREVFVIGTVFQKVDDGVILTGLPSRAAFPSGDVPKGMRMKAVAQFERVFIRGYGGEGVDGALVEVTAYRDGTFSYDTVLGSSSTIAAYTEASH